MTNPEAAEEPDTQDAGAGNPWQRFHPLTPFVSGGVVALGVVGYVISTQAARLFGGDPDDPTQGHLEYAAAAVGAVIVMAILGSWISWRAASFRLGTSTVELKSGILFRQHRQVRYDRVQAVDITRPLLARILGLSAVKVEAAGGSNSNITLSYLRVDKADEVRTELLRRVRRHARSGSPAPSANAATGTIPEQAGDPVTSGGGPESAHPDPGAGIGYAGERLIAALPAPRVWLASAMSINAAVLLVGIPILIGCLILGQTSVLPLLGPIVLGSGAAQFAKLAAWMNFRVEGSDEALRVQRGLTELRTSTVPLHRIQAVEVRQPLLWRPLDWWHITVNIAGVHHDPTKEDGALIPVGTRSEVAAILAAMGPTWSLSPIMAALDDTEAGRFAGAPPSAKWLDPISWRRIGYLVTPAGLVTRGGRLGRRAQFVPWARVQSLRVSAGPVQRRLGLASVRVLSTAGDVDPRVEHIATADAVDLFAVAAEAARRARHGESAAEHERRNPAEPAAVGPRDGRIPPPAHVPEPTERALSSLAEGHRPPGSAPADGGQA